MTELMQNIIPVPENYTSVSSTSLTCGQPGSGLRVTTENITRVPAGMFAGAALTAGIGDAELVVAAPVDAAAEGMTAITGIFKGFQGGACGRGELEPARRELALRWLAVTNELGGALGDQNAATRLVLSAHHGLVVGGKGDPAAVEPAIDGGIKDTGVAVPAGQRPAVADLLRRLAEARVDWGKYAAGWDLQQVTPTEVRLAPRGLVAKGVPGGAGSALTGTVRNAADFGTPLVIDVPGQAGQLNLQANNVTVTRDSRPAQLSDIQAGDTVTIAVGPGNIVERIDVSSPGGASAGAGRVVAGTVNENIEGRLTLMTAAGAQEFDVPPGAYIIREGREAQVGAISIEDSAVLLLDSSGQVESVFARPAGGDYVVEGVTDGQIRDHALAVRIGAKTFGVPLPAGANARVTRNGRSARLTDIQPGDRVTVRFNALSRPVAIDAQSAGRGAGLLRSRWLPLFCLLLLLLLLPLLFWQRRTLRTLLVLPGRRRIVNPDDVDGLTGP